MIDDVERQLLKSLRHYEAAVVARILDRQGHGVKSITLNDILSGNSLSDGDISFGLSFYHPLVVRHVLDKLVASDVVEVIDDDFGPTLIFPLPGFQTFADTLKNDKTHPLGKAMAYSYPAGWLSNALNNVNAALSKSLGVENPEARLRLDDLPLLIDRSGSEYSKAIGATGTVIEAVESSNTYASFYEEERNETLAVAKTFKEELTTSKYATRGQIAKFLDTLRLWAFRFRVEGEKSLIEAARKSVVDWWRLAMIRAYDWF